VRVAIAGAGIAGLSVAHALVQRGIRPTVIAPDSGYTAIGAGIVATHFADPVLAELASRSQAIIRGLVPVESCGMVRLALSDPQARILADMPGTEPGLPDGMVSFLSPEFRRRVVHATFAIDDFYLNPELLLNAMGQGTDRVRARIWNIEEGRVTIDGGTFEADWLVLALGPWSAWLVKGLALERRRVQLARAPLLIRSMLQVADTGLFARPNGDAATVGDGDACWRGAPDDRAARPTNSFRVQVEQQLTGMLGAEAECQPTSAGLIVRARDDRPVLRAAGRVLLLTGFGRLGLSLAPACGEQVAEMICGERGCTSGYGSF
jgi:glycine/D-amino acid oxidase-like deaminating enzyme